MKKLVTKQIRMKADEYLVQFRDSHEKTEHLNPISKMNDYLQSLHMTKEEKILLFKLRIWMVPVKANFSSRFKDNLQCDMCADKNSEESQMHLLHCKYLLDHPDLKLEILTIRYDDIFKDLQSQIKAIKVLKKIMSVRKIKLGIK